MTQPPDYPEFDRAFEGRRVCVTGGAGFIGSHLVETLCGLGASVIIIDDLTTGREHNLESFRSHVDFKCASILDERSLKQAISNTNYVFHLAAYVSAPGSVEEPDVCHAINSTGTLNVIRAAVDAGVERLIFASSSAVYGMEHQPPLAEELRPDPLSPYAMTKVAGEHLLRVANECYGLSTVSLRFFNVFGPRQTADSAYAAVIAAFADALLGDRQPRIDGDGLQTRDFVYVKDVAQALLRAAIASDVSAQSVFNVGTGQQATILDLFRTMARICQSNAVPRHADARIGDVRHSVAEITAAKDILGFEPQYSLAEGLQHTLQWYAQSKGQALPA